MTKARILYIDDEKENLNLFKQIFHYDYEVFVAENGQQALQMLKDKEEMAIVVTDQRMPGMPGTEILRRVAEQHPLSKKFSPSRNLLDLLVVTILRVGFPFHGRMTLITANSGLPVST